MIAKGRTTRQGLRDLNYYGPKPVKTPAETPPAAAVVAETSPAAEPPVAATAEAHEEGALVK